MRTAAVMALIASAAAAQNVRRIEVVADTTRVECGRTFKVRAIAFNNENKPVAAQFTYSTNLGERAPVTEDGTVTARVPGVVRVKATLWGSSFSNEISVQSVPARMEISPGPATIPIGDRRTFSFKAYDSSGREVATPAVSWSVLHGNGFPSLAAAVSQQGVVFGISEADLTLQAGFVYDPYLPGFQRQSFATIPIKIRPREAYRMRKIELPSENPGGLRRGLRMTNIAANEKGQFLHVSPVSAGNAASLLWDGERYAPVLSTGREGSIVASPIGEVLANALNDNGEVAITAANATGGSVLFRGTFDSQIPVLFDSTSIGSHGVVNGGFGLSRFSLNNDGYLLLLVNYSPRPGTTARQGLFRVESENSIYMVADVNTPLEGLGSPVRFDTNVHGTPSGRESWFLAYSGARMGLYRRRGFEPIQRVLGSGDELQGSRIRTVVADQAFWLSKAGDVSVIVQLENDQSWLGFLPGGDTAAAKWTRLGGAQRVCGSRPDGRVVLYGAPFGQPTGLYTIQGEQFTRHFRENNTLIDGEVGAGALGCYLDARDRPHLLIGTARDYLVLTRFDGADPMVLAKGGDPIAGSLRPFFTGFIQGKRDGDVYLAGGGMFSNHVWRLSGSALEPVLLPGTELRPGSWFAGGGLATNDAGQIVTTANNRYDTLRWAVGGEAEIVIANNVQLAPENTRVYGGYGVRTNNNHAVLTMHGTNRGDTRLMLHRDGSAETILSNGNWPELSFRVDGLGVVASWGDYALDDANRVLAQITSREGSSAWCLWENGTWRIAFESNAPVNGRAVAGYNSLRVSRETFYLRFNAVGGTGGIAIFDHAGLRTLVDPDDSAANGNIVNFAGLFQVNARGDAALQNYSFGSQTVGVLRSGSMRHIYSQTAATREGDVLFRLQDLIIMNDGRVYVLALTPDERQVLYEATPLD